MSGAIGWSTAELLARHVTADSELAWLEKARGMTVRALRVLLAHEAANGGARESDLHNNGDADDREPIHTLTVSASREDAWTLECARKVAAVVASASSSGQFLETLLAEAYSTLLELVPDSRALFEIDELENGHALELQAESAWCAERNRWRSEAEVLCENSRIAPELAARNTGDIPGSPPPTRPREMSESCATPESLDAEVRRLCVELSERDLALGIVAESARKAEVWRRLGFATEAQYARERLGVSLSSLKAKRVLASRAARVPELATALASGRIGYEAAYLLSRVVTPGTAKEWIDRAEQRTVKHLREEVDAVELLIRSGQPREQPPLDEEELDALVELERNVVSGDWVGRDRDPWAGEGAQSDMPHGQMSGTASQVVGAEREHDAVSQMSGDVSLSDGAETEWHGGSQMSQARLGACRTRNFGRVTVRFSVTERTYRFFRALERVFTRVSTRVCRAKTSFLRFLCENFCRIWLPALRNMRLTASGELPEYFAVYRRDAFRCTSPVCTRRDVTPHHLLFRSRGGGDEAENVASLCVWCHLSGVHEGRIAAEPPASKIRWRIGRSGTLRVEGRTVLR